MKKIKKSAEKKLVLKAANYSLSKNENDVFNLDSNELIKSISGDILYLDPPYNSRQYGANYHLLNTIARYDTFLPKGKTGLRDYKKSKYCSKIFVSKTFEDIIKKSNFQYIFLSYNNEGLMRKEEIKNIMQKYGKYNLLSTKYQRFRADKNRIHKANETIEYLHVLIKN